MVLQTHICKWQEMSKRRKPNWDPSAIAKQVRRGSQPPKHSSRTGTELQAAECSALFQHRVPGQVTHHNKALCLTTRCFSVTGVPACRLEHIQGSS